MPELTIERLGHLGDGIARLDGRPVYVSGALPGERVRGEVVIRDRLGDRLGDIDILEASPDRIEPSCKHFGTCGGCVLQHMSPALRDRMAVDQVRNVLEDRGLATMINAPMTVGQHSRRRATLAGLKLGNRTIVGFHESGSHHVVPLEECAVIRPEILAGMAACHELTRLAAPKKGTLDIAVTVSLAGLDISLKNVDRRDADRLRLPLVELAATHGLARLSLGEETLVERQPPLQRIGGVDVVPPPGGFLQASEESEEAMGQLVAEIVGKVKYAADLFAGVGTFAFHLSKSARVLAVESHEPSVQALDRAARHARGILPVKAEKRDLFHRPLLPQELGEFDAVVFDPPRAGAAEQSSRLAAGKVPLVVGVSCSPATFARDARILVDGGYRLESMTPVLQFLYSPHLEVIGVFRK